MQEATPIAQQKRFAIDWVLRVGDMAALPLFERALSVSSDLMVIALLGRASERTDRPNGT
jgi:hypothetical protein